MDILITGTDGFIGAVLQKELRAQGIRVFGTVFLRPPQEDEVFCDVRDPDACRSLSTPPVDAVIHTAGIVDQTVPSRPMFEVNAEGTRRMLQWARGARCGHFIHISSVSVYGLRTNGENRTEAATPRYDGRLAIPYMRSKALAERYVENGGVPYTMLRLPAVLGPNDSYLTPAIVPRLQTGSFYFCGREDRLFSTLYVRNLPLILHALLRAGPLHEAYNCADHHMTWRALVEEYARHLGVRPGNRRRSIVTVLTRIRDKKWALIMTFSRFGGHYPSDRLWHRLGENPVRYPWQEGVREAVRAFCTRQTSVP